MFSNILNLLLLPISLLIGPKTGSGKTQQMHKFTTKKNNKSADIKLAGKAVANVWTCLKKAAKKCVTKVGKLLLWTYSSRGIHGVSYLDKLEAANHDLIKAACEGNKELLTDAINRGADVECPEDDKTDTDATLIACRYNHDHLIEILVRNGADVNKSYSDTAFTPLHFAALISSDEVVQELIEQGADVDARDGEGTLPLNNAIVKQRPRLVKMLVDAGADVHAPNKEHKSPIIQAASVGNVEILEILLDAGAHVNDSRWGLDETPVHAAMYENKTDVVHFLLCRGAALSTQSSPMFWATSFGNVDLAKLLLDQGIDPDAVSTCLFIHPLVQAVGSNVYEMVDLLLQHGANPNARQPYDGFSPLFKAASRVGDPEGSVEIARLLLDNGADVNLACHITGDTALHRAIELQNDEFARFLLERGADINFKNREGRTPLPPSA